MIAYPANAAVHLACNVPERVRPAADCREAVPVLLHHIHVINATQLTLTTATRLKHNIDPFHQRDSLPYAAGDDDDDDDVDDVATRFADEFCAFTD